MAQEAKHANPLLEVLHSKKCGEYLAEKKQKLLTLKPKNTIEDAIRLLGDNKILSAPVMDANGEFLGFVDYLDILSHVIAAAPDDKSLEKDELGTLKIAGRAIALVEISRIINGSGANAAVTVFEEDPLSEAAKILAKGPHRVALMNKEKKVTGVLSQSDIVNFLQANIGRGHCKEVGTKTMKELGFNSSAIFGEDIEHNIITILRRLFKEKVSALALVDSNGALAGNFSASDLRGLYLEKFPHLLDSALDFITERSPDSLKPTVCRAETPLKDVLSELTSNKLHHMWVVDGDYKPVGIVALGDVLKIAVSDK